MIKNNSSNPKTALVDHVMCHSISIVWLSESHKQQRIFRHQNYGNAPRLSNWSFDIVSWPVFIGNSSHLDVYVWRAKFSMNAAFKGSVPIHVPLSKCPDSEPSRHTDSNNVHLKSKKKWRKPRFRKGTRCRFHGAVGECCMPSTVQRRPTYHILSDWWDKQLHDIVTYS